MFSPQELSLFAVLAGNDYSKSFVKELCKELHLSTGEKDGVEVDINSKFYDILSFIKQMKSDNICHYMKSVLSQELYIKFNQAFE